MINLRVIYDGEQHDIVVRSRQVVVWEQVSRGNTLTRLNDAPNVADFYFLAHLVEVKEGRFTGSLQEFMSSVDVQPLPPDDLGPMKPVR